MKTKTPAPFSAVLLALNLLLIPTRSEAVGTWTALTTSPPIGVNNCLLLTDGTVLAMNGGGQCAKLTPDIHGSYINGTWTSLPSMNGDLILGQPSTATGNFNEWPAAVGSRRVAALSGPGNLTINQVAASGGGVETSTNYVMCGNDGAGATVIYKLNGGSYGYTLTNITIYGTLDSTGSFSNSLPINPILPEGFFQLRLP